MPYAFRSERKYHPPPPLSPTPPASTYITNFPLTESPISEGGNWINTGLDWSFVNTASGVARGTQSGTVPPYYNDSYAMFTQDFGNDYRIEGTVFLVGGITTRFLEIEVNLRWSQHAHYATGYECTMAKDHEYDGMNHWPADGSLGTDPSQYRTLIPAQPIHGPTGILNGDIYYGQIVSTPGGPTITAGIIRGGTDFQMYSVQDTDPAASLTGQPAIGFYNSNDGAAGVPADNARFGFSSIKIIKL